MEFHANEYIGVSIEHISFRKRERVILVYFHVCGSTYETGGGSSHGGLCATFGRIDSRKEKPHMVQTRIDTDPSCKAGKNAVHFVGQQAKWFHAEAIPEHKANRPYFINAFRETQKPRSRRT
jgi:hypothetical protein